jgi:hypothetical protein
VIEIKAKAVILRICGVLMKSVLMSGFMIDWCGGGGGGGVVVARVVVSLGCKNTREPGSRRRESELESVGRSVGDLEM